jgi:hypothetical protein
MGTGRQVNRIKSANLPTGYEPDGEGGMDHRGMCQQEKDAVERVKVWLGPRPITPELRDAIITMGGKIPPGTKILERNNDATRASFEDYKLPVRKVDFQEDGVRDLDL